MTTRTQAERAALIAEARHSINPGGQLVNYIGLNQRAVLNELMGGEEGEWYAQTLIELARSIDLMPRTYQTEGIAMKDKVVHLHYFRGSVDSWIIELDVSAPEDGGQHLQAWGQQRVNPAWGRGTGYISIPELLDAGMELDLHWKPITVAQLDAKLKGR